MALIYYGDFTGSLFFMIRLWAFPQQVSWFPVLCKFGYPCRKNGGYRENVM
jgi:hypothetical protein